MINMWTCPTCERKFKTNNQSHSCVSVTIDDLFEGRPDTLILAFDKLLVDVIDWEPNSVGTSQNTIIFTNRKAWLILRPMQKQLDVKFYFGERIHHPLIAKVTTWNNKFAHHIRVKDESDITMDLLNLLKKGFDFAMR